MVVTLVVRAWCGCLVARGGCVAARARVVVVVGGCSGACVHFCIRYAKIAWTPLWNVCLSNRAQHRSVLLQCEQNCLVRQMHKQTSAIVICERCAWVSVVLLHQCDGLLGLTGQN